MVKFGTKTSKIEKETWERTEIVETFNPETMWKEFRLMSPSAQYDWVHRNPDNAVKLFWFLDGALISCKTWADDLYRRLFVIGGK